MSLITSMTAMALRLARGLRVGGVAREFSLNEYRAR